MMLESISGWLTPTSLFLLLNFVIATIWLTSILTNNNHHHHHDDHHHHHYSHPPVTGAQSLLGRVKSINLGFHKLEPVHNSGYEDQYFPPAEQVYATITAHKTASSSLARAPSILDRVRSVNFNDFHFSFGHVSPQVAETGPHPARAPSSLLERVRSINFTDLNYLPHFSGFRSEPSVPEPEPKPDRQDHPTPARETHSLLQRVKSITLPDLNNFSVFRSDSSEPEIEPVRRRRRGSTAEKMRRSESEKGERSTAESVGDVERRRPETARIDRTVSIGGDVEVDAKADDFINRFKQQLKLQRLDSILQYKEMITRGASK